MKPRGGEARIRVTRVGQGARRGRRDVVAVEEPMEIRVRPTGAPAGVPVAVTMRTPGDDFALVAGFLLTEGVLGAPEAVEEITYCRSGTGPQEYNVVEARLRPGVDLDLDRLTRNVFTSSSCGVCGKASLDAVEVLGCAAIPLEGSLRISADQVCAAPERLRDEQPHFARTGGIHGAALIDGGGEVVVAAEDVGRHNAVDKVLGRAFLEGRLPLHELALVVSGRSSFEIVQKAVVAGVAAVLAVGAPSSLAVELAQRFDLTLAGFVRPDGFNLYSAGERVVER